MQLARLIGILVVFGVPAIIGGGIIYGFFHSFAAVWIYEALLLVLAIITVRKSCFKPAPTEH
jgi:hypothetical protein